MRHVIATLGALALAVAGILALTAAPASASSYDGTDPLTTGCTTGAYTARSHRIFKGPTVVGNIELRYSPKCRTAWARITRMHYPTCTPNGTSSFDCGSVGIWRNSDGQSRGCDIRYYHGQICYTPQLSDRGVTSFAWGWVLDTHGYATSGQTASY